jgi:hypothetical protein
MEAVLGSTVTTNHFDAPSFATVDKFHVTRAVDVFNVLSVANVGPKGVTPGWTDIYVAAGLVPLVFVAVKRN